MGGQSMEIDAPLVRTPNALATDEALGAVIRHGDLSRLHRVLETPLNWLFEAHI